MNKNKILIFVMILFCMICRYSFSGFKYYPTMDDNNQYGIYYLRNDNIYENVIMHYQSYNVRPLAFFTDAYVFSFFWNHMYLLLLLMIILHFSTAVMFQQIMEKLHLSFGFLGTIIFTLSPFLVQATYWISASSRLVVSLFFCILSIRLFIFYLEKKRKPQDFLLVIAIILLNLLSVGYYEQTIVFNFVFFLYIIYKEKKPSFIAVPIFSTIVIGIYYISSMLNNTMQDRGNITFQNIGAHIFATIGSIIKKFTVLQGKILINGIEFAKEHLLILLFVLSIISFLAFFVMKEKEHPKNMYGKSFWLGLLLFVVPFAPFLILQDSFVDVRNFYISYLGLGLMVASIYEVLLSHLPNRNIADAGVICICVLIFMLGNAAEVSNYREIWEFDNLVASKIIESVDENVFENKEAFSVDYDVSLLDFKKDNLIARSVLEEDWALMGKIQLLRNSTKIGQIYLKSNQKPSIYINKNLEVLTNF